MAPGLQAYSRPISGAEKVAILLLALERSIAGQLLHKFDQDDISVVRAASETLEPITASDLANLVDEFAERFAASVNLLGKSGEMSELLDSALSEAAAEEAASAPQAGQQVSVWDAVGDVDEEKLIAFIQHEHPQTAAVFLARSGAPFAAVILGKLPCEVRDGLVRRLLVLAPVGDAVMQMFESSIARVLLGDDGSAAADAARARLANIINLMDNEEKSAVIDALLQDKPAEAEDVKRRLFDFEDIVDMPDKARLMLFDKVGTDDVVKALVGAGSELSELVLSSLSSRSRRMVEAELRQPDNVDEKDIKDARRGIAAAALQLAEQGEIELRKIADEAA